MTREEYTKAVGSVLDAHSSLAVARLNTTLANLPPKAKRMTIEIFVDADGEGFLNIRVGLEGPDLYVLNRAIADSAELFTTRMRDTEMQPGLPLMESGGETFSVQDTLADIAAAWIVTVWKQANQVGVFLPTTVETHDGYDTLTPIQLRR